MINPKDQPLFWLFENVALMPNEEGNSQVELIYSLTFTEFYKMENVYVYMTYIYLALYQ